VGSDEALAILDEDGEELILDAFEATTVLAVTQGFEAATVSACPTCRSRVLACVALADLLRDVAAPPRGRELADLAEDAPTLHLYVQDLATSCGHPGWHDPGFTEWSDVLHDVAGPPRGRR
jgi:hypothetical protein